MAYGSEGVVGGVNLTPSAAGTPVHQHELFWAAIIVLVLAICLGFVHIGSKK
jgi:hypothetical protein